MSVTVQDFYLPLILICGLLLCWRGLSVLRENTASGLRSTERSLRDERQMFQQLTEKLMVDRVEQGRLAELHALERRHQISEDAQTAREALRTPYVDPSSFTQPPITDIVNTDIG